MHRKNCQNKSKRNDYRKNKSKGKFSAAEQELYKEFSEMRKLGKRVGPHWMKRAMQRHVKKLYAGHKMEEAAKRFKASGGWMSRFTKRFRISLRCKTNVKRVPIEQRVGKLKRYFALFRLRLQSDRGRAGYSTVWGMFPARNRWSLDQVPAGFFAPGRTYEHKGSKRVVISANECADDHRECTLQVVATLIGTALMVVWLLVGLHTESD